MRHVVHFIVLCWAFASLPAGPAHAERRLALSVGIDVYDNLPAHEQLRKAVNDARAMGAALRELGFEAAVVENVPKLDFTRAWQRFLNRLEAGDTAALFFAGHGVEIAGLNYLLPRDVPKVVPGEDRVLAEASIRFNGLMDDLRDKKVRVALFIVDACRDNPFRDGRGRSVGGTRGLARIEAAKGSFVMYSAGAGEQALDRLSDADRDPNSIYTRALLPILKTPGLSLPEIARRVRRMVVEAARGAGRDQTPAYYDELLGDFVLKSKQPSAAAVEWTRVDKSSIAELETFARRHPASAEAGYARARAAEIAAVRSKYTSGLQSALKTFGQRGLFPNPEQLRLTRGPNGDSVTITRIGTGDSLVAEPVPGSPGVYRLLNSNGVEIARTGPAAGPKTPEPPPAQPPAVKAPEPVPAQRP